MFTFKNRIGLSKVINRSTLFLGVEQAIKNKSSLGITASLRPTAPKFNASRIATSPFTGNYIALLYSNV